MFSFDSDFSEQHDHYLQSYLITDESDRSEDRIKALPDGIEFREDANLLFSHQRALKPRGVKKVEPSNATFHPNSLNAQLYRLLAPSATP